MHLSAAPRHWITRLHVMALFKIATEVRLFATLLAATRLLLVTTVIRTLRAKCLSLIAHTFPFPGIPSLNESCSRSFKCIRQRFGLSSPQNGLGDRWSR